jgi:hypothetical protein
VNVTAHRWSFAWGSTSAAQALGRFFALQWHCDGLGSCVVFEGRKDHGDAAVAAGHDTGTADGESRAHARGARHRHPAPGLPVSRLPVAGQSPLAKGAGPSHARP